MSPKRILFSAKDELIFESLVPIFIKCNLDVNLMGDKIKKALIEVYKKGRNDGSVPMKEVQE